MDLELIKTLVTATGPMGLLAYGMFLHFSKMQQDDKARLIELIAQWRGQSEQLIQVVKDNTTAMTAMKAAIESPTRQIGQ